MQNMFLYLCLLTTLEFGAASNVSGCKKLKATTAAATTLLMPSPNNEHPTGVI